MVRSPWSSFIGVAVGIGIGIDFFDFSTPIAIPTPIFNRPRRRGRPRTRTGSHQWRLHHEGREAHEDRNKFIIFFLLVPFVFVVVYR